MLARAQNKQAPELGHGGECSDELVGCVVDALDLGFFARACQVVDDAHFDELRRQALLLLFLSPLGKLGGALGRQGDRNAPIAAPLPPTKATAIIVAVVVIVVVVKVVVVVGTRASWRKFGELRR